MTKRTLLFLLFLASTLLGWAQNPAVNFELIQPATSPDIDLDVVIGSAGQNLIYDMDGDGDNDFLFFGRGTTSDYQYIAFLNDGQQHYRREDLSHDFGIAGNVQRPIIRVADLNQDGINDIVVGGERFNSGGITRDLGPTKVYFGDAQGQLHEQSQIVLQNSNIGDIRIEDFDGDTSPDIFISGVSGTSLHLNDGSGNFMADPLTGFTTGICVHTAVSKPYAGGVDVVVEVLDGVWGYVIYRYENGVFTEVIRDFQSRTRNGPVVHGMEFGEANGDGFPDLILQDDVQLTLYLNDQSGSYTLDTSNDFDNLPEKFQQTLQFADFNQDGAAEVFFTKEPEELAVFWNDGTGNYGSHETYDVSRLTPWMTVGDVNGDGFPDIINIGEISLDIGFGVADPSVTFMYINDQMNGFNQAQFNVFPQFQHGDIQLLDANEDGHQDMLVSGAVYEDHVRITELYLNDGTGAFTQASGQPFDGLEQASIAMADFNGDTHQDVVLSGINESDVVLTKLYVGDGAGNFTEEAINVLSGVMGASVTLDANGDGHPDVLVVGNDGADVLIADLYLNNGTGTLTLHGAGVSGLDDVSVAVGDIDDDADVDLLIQGKDGMNVYQMLLYTNDGLGNFTEVAGHGLEALRDGKVLLFDIDGDEDLDIYLSGGDQMIIYTNDGTGSFSETQREAGPTRSTAEFGDIDLDGDLDLIESGEYGASDVPRTFVYFNDGSGDFTRESVGALHGIIDGAIALGDLDGDLDLEIILSGAIGDDVTSASRIYRNTSCGLNNAAPIMGSLEVSACESYIWEGTVYTTSGVYQELLTSSDGCDSTATLNLTILEPSAGDDNVSVCESYEWEGTVYTASGTYQEILTNAVGCDSTATLNLTILEPTSGDDTVETCESYEWEGTVYTASGTYQEILTNAVGCDSTATLNLTILEPTSGDDDVEACESYEWEGTVYSASGTYQEILTNAVGCDSTATLNLTILEPTSGDDEVEACESYEWEGTVYTASGTYQEILTNSVGCDSTATLNLTILEPTSGDDEVEACENYEWEGTLYTTSGTYQEILTNAVGCDSTATLNLTILEPTSGDDEVEACESYEWEGTLYTASGTYQEILTNAVGCDSTATLNLTILEPTSGDEEVEACESYEWEGTVYTNSGTYQEILTNAVGCDSTATLNLTILEPTSGDDEVEACESYEWEGTVYTASGTYQEILTNAVGCDSTATLNLTILEPTSGDDTVEACESYEWEGAVYTNSGIYQEILTNAAGCDSTATLNLTILGATSGRATIEACEIYEWQGRVYTNSGTYQQLLTSSLGCDSTATLKLTILEPSARDVKVTTCGSYEWEGNFYTTSGIYQEILTNVAGCDSTVTLDLTVLEVSSGNENVSSCGSYRWQGQTYTTSGTYQEILTNSVGCDSTATLNLTILEPTVGDAEVEACGSFEWEGNTYTASGTYQELLTNDAGCDSTATLNLTILESSSSFTEVEACESYEWNNLQLTTSGIHEVILTNAVGCDSLATLDLTLLESAFGEADVFACGSYEWEGETYETSGVFETTLTASNGCDSLATLNLTIGQEAFNELIMDVCADFTFGSQQITTSGIYQETFSSSQGCDSTVVLTAQVFDAPDSGILQEGNTLRAADDAEGLSFQWYDCSTDQQLAGEVNREFTPGSDGTYSLEISNGVCIIRTACFDYRQGTVLSADREASTVKAYPNPTIEKITISFPQAGRSNVAIYGLDGRLIVEADVSGQNRFEYALPEPGIYLIKVGSSSGQQEFIKVLRK